MRVLGRELNELDDLLIPVAVPSAGLFSGKTLADVGEDVGIVPPAAFVEVVLGLELAEGRGVPEGFVG